MGHLKVFMLCCMMMVVFPVPCHGSKILMYPLDAGYNSRLMNMFKLGRMLIKANHQITFVVSDRMKEDALFKLAEGGKVDSNLNVISYKTPPVDPTVMHVSTENQDFLEALIIRDFAQTLNLFGQALSIALNSTLQDKTVIDQLNAQQFDLIIADEFSLYPRVIAAERNIPIILYCNFGPMSSDSDIIPRYSLAYVNANFNRFSDVMTFLQRLENVWDYLKIQWEMSGIYTLAEAVCQEHGYGKSCDNIRGIHKTVNLVLMNRNDVTYYPAPYMPHIISSEGFFLDKPKPLDSYYTDVIKRSGRDGIIVASFGSMFRRLAPKYRTIFAEAFSKMPQTVIWSYEGETPEGLGDNTIVSKWIPQTDLLANPAVKLLITQCGASSLFEALNCGLPVVAIPFIGDQEYNCLKLADRVKSAKFVKLKTITSEQLQSVMEEAINDKTYRANARKATSIYHDQPIDPRNKTLFWIEYVIRHKGAAHLRSAGENQLNFFQYYLLDIAGLVAVILFTALISLIVILKAVINCLLKTLKHKKD
ncbi:unnamed protein product [Owenia fusiformis]|uniref:UDP-glucuronosyltransferase n=1 Tax=Owenia fusiformis TaxID=6347 RepID=A0A8J1UWM8_OWEFU|nr:unnamed protein product [Owenia fusiformis]